LGRLMTDGAKQSQFPRPALQYWAYYISAEGLDAIGTRGKLRPGRIRLCPDESGWLMTERFSDLQQSGRLASEVVCGTRLSPVTRCDRIKTRLSHLIRAIIYQRWVPERPRKNLHKLRPCGKIRILGNYVWGYRRGAAVFD
jgi:hypothetical protein